jgi:cell division protein ZipA
MLDSLLSLRFFLFVIGAVFVLCVYFWGRANSKRNTRIKYEPRRARFEPAKRRGSSGQAKNIEREPPLEELDGPSAATDVDVDVEQISESVLVAEPSVQDLPTITREGDTEPPATVRTNVKTDPQLELTFDEAVGVHSTDANDDLDAPDETLIALFVRPTGDRGFDGPDIVRSMNSVGLRFGDMGIFHHYGAGELRAEVPLFSVANIVEPGNFDLQKIDEFTTPGLALFLRLPGPLDGPVTFELFLNTGQRLAEALAGDLYGAPDRLLDVATIDKMRRSALPFAHGR